MIKRIPHVELLVAEPFVKCPYMRYSINMLALGDGAFGCLVVSANMTFSRRAQLRTDNSEHGTTCAEATARANALLEELKPHPLIIPTVDELSSLTALSYGEYVAFPATLGLIIQLVILVWCGPQWWNDTRLWRAIDAVVDSRTQHRRSRQARCVAVAQVLTRPEMNIMSSPPTVTTTRRMPMSNNGQKGAVKGGAGPSSSSSLTKVDPTVAACILRHIGFLVRHGKVAADDERENLVVTASVDDCVVKMIESGKRKRDEHEENVHRAGHHGVGPSAAKKRAVHVKDAH